MRRLISGNNTPPHEHATPLTRAYRRRCTSGHATLPGVCRSPGRPALPHLNTTEANDWLQHNWREWLATRVSCTASSCAPQVAASSAGYLGICRQRRSLSFLHHNG